MMILIFTFRKKNLMAEVLLVSRTGSTGLSLVSVFVLLCKIENFKTRIIMLEVKCSAQYSRHFLTALPCSNAKG